MVDFKRYIVSMNKQGEWRAYDKKTNNSYDDIVSNSRDKLSVLLKMLSCGLRIRNLNNS